MKAHEARQVEAAFGELLERLRRLPRFSEEDLELVRQAYQEALKTHGDQRRRSGEPYMLHPIQVAHILLDNHWEDPVMIAAALLHDTVEDAPNPQQRYEELRRAFEGGRGRQIVYLVDALTKLTKLERVRARRAEEASQEEERERSKRQEERRRQEQARNLRKLFVAMTADLRVVVLKLADRLHNLRTLDALPPEKQTRIARETMEVYVPLAHRTGMMQIKRELEDLAFRVLNPQAYEEIRRQLRRQWAGGEQVVRQFQRELEAKLREAGLEFRTLARLKTVYSTYEKMRRKGVPHPKYLSDIFAVRILVPTQEDCYRALGVVHSHWHYREDQFDDYIARPKETGYKAVHTVIEYRNNGRKIPIEVQIRTEATNDEAEYGGASHWVYKGDWDGEEASVLERRLDLLRLYLEQAEGEDEEKLIEEIVNDVLSETIYVFTPKGDVIELPRGSTPIDFAYRIHTEVGHRCIGARVNGRPVPLNYELRNGDEVQIITGRTPHPSRDWLRADLGFVRTSSARKKILRWFRQQERQRQLEEGRQLLNQALRRYNPTRILDLDRRRTSARAVHEAVLRLVGQRLLRQRGPAAAAQIGYQVKDGKELLDLDTFYVALGAETFSIQQVINWLLEEEEGAREPEPPPPMPQPPVGGKERREPLDPEAARQLAEKIRGADPSLIRFARCCNPRYGEGIVGYITRGREHAISVHRSDCPNLSHFAEERLLPLGWHRNLRGRKQVQIEAEVLNRHGALAEITGLLSSLEVNLSGVVTMAGRREGVRRLRFTLEIDSLQELPRILDRLQQLRGVEEVRRLQ